MTLMKQVTTIVSNGQCFRCTTFRSRHRTDIKELATTKAEKAAAEHTTKTTANGQQA